MWTKLELGSKLVDICLMAIDIFQLNNKKA